MSQGRTHQDPYWDRRPPSQNGVHPPSSVYEAPFPTYPLRNNYGNPNGREYPRHTRPHKQPYLFIETRLNSRNGKAGHTSLPPQYHQPPSPNDIDNLQSRIRHMLSDSDSPSQQTTYPTRPSRGRAARGQYYSPPLHRGQPHEYSGTRNTRSQGQVTTWDNCEDITAYALGIVKSLEIPEDERREKEEFCGELEEIVQQIRSSMLPSFYPSCLSSI